MFARLSLYRFQGSLRSFPRFRSGELDYNTKAHILCQAVFEIFFALNCYIFQGVSALSISCGGILFHPSTFGGHFRYRLLK